jgi:hypothetical protein
LADNDGTLPLHFACCNNEVLLDVVRYLVQEYPESLQVTNNGGWLPLHFAFERGMLAPLDVVQYLVQKYPDLHIHQACSNMAALDIVRYLVQEYPESLKVTDNDGDLPLHYVHLPDRHRWTSSGIWCKSSQSLIRYSTRVETILYTLHYTIGHRWTLSGVRCKSIRSLCRLLTAAEGNPLTDPREATLHFKILWFGWNLPWPVELPSSHSHRHNRWYNLPTPPISPTKRRLSIQLPLILPSRRSSHRHHYTLSLHPLSSKRHLARPRVSQRA